MENDSFRAVVLDHVIRYPLSQPADLYKLAFQAALGSEHAVGSIGIVQTRLVQEITGLGAGSAEELIDPISGDGRIVRVHLRPFVQAGLHPLALVQAFMRTAAVVHGSAKELEECLAVIRELARMKKINIDSIILGDYFRQLADNNYPAVHHSPEYNQAYHPAYRVVARDFLPVQMITWKSVRGND